MIIHISLGDLVWAALLAKYLTAVNPTLLSSSMQLALWNIRTKSLCILFVDVSPLPK